MATTEFERLKASFPTTLRDEVQRALRVVPQADHPPTDTDVGPVFVARERVRIPHRIYAPEPSQARVDGLPLVQREIVACLYTRHHDGFVREASLRMLLGGRESWGVPFVVQLVGEYVLEIVSLLQSQAALFQQPRFATFARENPEFLELTRKRATSYWNCYYRRRFSRLADYPGIKLLDRLAEVTRQAERGGPYR